MIRLLTLSALFISSFASIKDCDPSSSFRPTQLSISPDPPIPGQLVKLTLVFDNTGDEVTEGTVTTSISLNSIPISPSTVDLCENTVCPIIHGINDRSTETIFPSVTGIIKSHVTWTDQKGNSLLCIESSLKVTGASSLQDIYKHKYQDYSLRGFDKEREETTTTGQE